ncbi:MAG: prepilin-type N-terminal cleavage/methylation domain-containing protein [Clostridiales bacterium]|jgi:hypothetical protein|nr:prepilin-type N-terminal cleavage/methylation domain-containing protein [Clostridiales bacterium]
MEEKGITLLEVLVCTAIFSICLIPTLSIIRQSAINYEHALGSYHADLELTNILSDARQAAKEGASNEFNIALNNESRFECVVIFKESTGGSVIVTHPPGTDLIISEAHIDGDYNLITAAVRDIHTGVIKTQATLY